MNLFLEKTMHSLKAIPLIVIGLLVAIAYFFQASPAERIADNLTRHSLTEEMSAPLVEQALIELLRGTYWEEKWQINKPPKANHINIYIFDSRSPHFKKRYISGLQQLTQNCAYIGTPGVIVCDESLFGTFLEDVGVSDRYEGHVLEEQLLAQRQFAFIHWIIGHEIGHVVSKHKPAHFKAREFHAMVASSTVGHQLEYEADEFVINRIRYNNELRISIETMLLDVINASIRRKIGEDIPQGAGIIYDYTNKKIVRYARCGTHPEYVVRATRMIEVSAKTSRNNTLHNMIGPFIAHMKEKSDCKKMTVTKYVEQVTSPPGHLTQQ